MRRSNAFAVAACAMWAGPSFADHVIDTYPFWDGNVTNGWVAVAQSFIAPEHSVLDSYMFGFEGSKVAITFSIVQWDETSGPVGGPLYSTNVAGFIGDVVVSDIGLSLTPGEMYAAVVDMNGYTAESVHWMQNVDGNPTGDASWFDGSGWQYLNSGWSTKFRAEFTAVPGPAAVALLGVAGLAGSRRRRA
jgi:MYXO-CTERM domain-containing protein